MRKALRVLMLTVTAASCATLGGFATVQAQTVVSEAAHQQFVFAYRLLQDNEDALAAEAFDEFLGSYPEDEKKGDALYYRALLARRMGQPANGVKYLENLPATKVVPGHAVLLLRGQMYADLKQYDEALKSLEQINADGLEPPTRAAVLYLRGLVYRGAGNLDAAAGQLAAAGQVDSPLRARALVDLARIQAQQTKVADAVASLRAAIELKAGETSAEAARLAGDLSYQAADYAGAIGFYSVVLTQHQASPHVGPAALGVMWAQVQVRQYDGVTQSYEQYKRLLPNADRATATYLAGTAMQELGKHQQAIDTFNLVLTDVGAAEAKVIDKALFKIAASEFELGQFDAMVRTIGRLKTEHPQSPVLADADFLNAASAARRGDPAAGAAQLTALVNQGPDHPYHAQALLQRAQLYEANDQPEPAANDYTAYLALAAAKPDAFSGAAISQAMLRLTDLSYRLAKYEQAGKIAGELLKRPELDPLLEQDALFRRALSLVKLQQNQQAYDTLQALLTKFPNTHHLWPARYYRGLLLMGMQKPDEAAADLLAAAAPESNLSDALKAGALRVASLRLRDNPDPEPAAKATVALEKFIGTDKLIDEERLFLGRYFTGKKEPKAALKYLAGLIDEGNQTVAPRVRSEALLLTARGLRLLGDPAGAVQAFRQLIAQGTDFDLAARLELADTLREAGRPAEALTEYESLINAETTRIAGTALFESARIHRGRAVAQRAAGDAAAATASLDQARKMLKRLVLLYSFPQLSPLPELAHLELSEIAAEAGQDSLAESELKALAEKYTGTPWADYARAGVAAMQQKKGDAVFLLTKLREQAATLDPRLNERVTAGLKALQ